jgi:hypothetical protein
MSTLVEHPRGFTVKEPPNECAIHSANTKVNYLIVNAESLELGIASIMKKKSLVHESESLI